MEIMIILLAILCFNQLVTIGVILYLQHRTKARYGAVEQSGTALHPAGAAVKVQRNGWLGPD